MPQANVSTALFVLEILLAAIQQKLVNSKQKGDRGLLLLKLGGLKPAAACCRLVSRGDLSPGRAQREEEGPISAQAQRSHLRDTGANR